MFNYNISHKIRGD